MKENKKQLKFRLTDSELRQLTEKANLMNLTPANLLKRHALQIIYRDDFTSDKFNPFYLPRYDVKTYVNLNQAMHQQLKKEAKKNGWTLSKELRFRLASSLVDVAAFYPDEITALKKSRYAVDTVGRNLHYIISKKQLLTINDAGFLQDVQRLNDTIVALKNQVDNLTTLSINRHNVRTRGKRDGR